MLWSLKILLIEKVFVQKQLTCNCFNHHTSFYILDKVFFNVQNTIFISEFNWSRYDGEMNGLWDVDNSHTENFLTLFSNGHIRKFWQILSDFYEEISIYSIRNINIFMDFSDFLASNGQNIDWHVHRTVCRFNFNQFESVQTSPKCWRQ